MNIDEKLKQWATPRQAEIIDAVIKHGSFRAAAVALGISDGTVGNSIARVRKKAVEVEDEDDAVTKAAKAGGIEDSRNLSHFWKIVKDDTGNGYSLFVKNPKTGTSVAITDMVREAIEGINLAKPVILPARPTTAEDHLLVVDLADVHFLKLAVRTETGYEYNRDVARHRVVEGTRSLLRMARPMGIGQVLFVLGNDILHVDGPRSSTTSGTYQDTDGTVFQGFTDAALALKEAIDVVAEAANVDLLHCMSNHDWLLGWSLSQTVAAPYRAPHFANPRIRATDYNLSEIHRKYYRFGTNLMGFTHGDGAKEEKLYGVMVDEARQHISECDNLYWYLHHVHHKIRKTRGELEYLQEKDHTGMTAIMAGNTRIQGTHLNIEYVRSPSAPDGWHHRNAYVNLQAVECFVHHPTMGQRARFTEWF